MFSPSLLALIAVCAVLLLPRKALFAILLFGLQSIYTVCNFSNDLYSSLLSCRLSFFPQNARVTPKSMRHDLRHLDKLPKHLAVSLPKAQSVAEQLVSAVELSCWCASAGVPMLTIYEAEGKLAGDVDTLKRRIGEELTRFFEKESHVPSAHVCLIDPPEEPLLASNGTKPDLQVNIASRAASRQYIVNAAQAFARSEELSNMDVEDVDRKLSKPYFPEPQLLIVFDSKVDLNGFPAWQIRLTEIFHVPGNDRVEVETFLRALFKYSKCDQRFGR